MEKQASTYLSPPPFRTNTINAVQRRSSRHSSHWMESAQYKYSGRRVVSDQEKEQLLSTSQVCFPTGQSSSEARKRFTITFDSSTHLSPGIAINPKWRQYLTYCLSFGLTLFVVSGTITFSFLSAHHHLAIFSRPE